MAQDVTQVAMEATGVYWKLVWHVLEEMTSFELLLVNAHHVENVPGRKTDASDAAWLAQLLEYGLLRSSFVPPPVIALLRDLTRYRKKIVEAHTAETQRIQKLLELTPPDIEDAASSSCAAFRATSDTRSPRAAKSVAIERPRPRDPPVTRT